MDQCAPAEAGKKPNGGKIEMNTMLLKMQMKFQDLMNREEGQDLVEYALLLSLIALAAVAMIKNVGTAVNAIFTNINTSI
jgi:pilus assembly protein Flp/PilA